MYSCRTWFRLAGEFCSICGRTMVETWIDEELQGDSGSWTPSSIVRARLVQCFPPTFWWSCYVSCTFCFFSRMMSLFPAHRIWPRTRLWVRYEHVLQEMEWLIVWDRIGSASSPILTQRNWREWCAWDKVSLGQRSACKPEEIFQIGPHVVQLHMIENRFRIEKQILLGRQAVHRAYKGKHRIAPHEPRPLLLQKSILDPTLAVPQGPSFSISPPSGSDLPLSVDTDAEAAFARGSMFYKRGHSSKNPSPTRTLDKDVRINSARRRRWASQDQVPMEDGDNADDEEPEVVTANPRPNQISESPTSSFFSRFRTNSVSKLSLPFSENGYSARRDPSVDSTPDYHWSSESSSDEDYPVT